MPKQAVFAVVTFLHDLFTAAWIGGLITLGLTVMPAARKVLGKGPVMRELMNSIQKRLSILVYVCIGGLVTTGLLLSNRNPAFEGLFRFSNTYTTVLTIKHVFVLAMVAVALYRSLALGGSATKHTPDEERLSGGLMFLNVGLGVVVLLLSAIGAVLSSAPVSPLG